MINPVVLASGATGVNATVFTTASVAVNTDDILCLDVVSNLEFSGTTVDPVVTGLGANWVVEAFARPSTLGIIFSPFYRQTRFRTKVPATTSGVVTITYTIPGNSIGQFAHALIRLEGASTEGVDGKGAFRQTVSVGAALPPTSRSPDVNINALPIVTPSNLKFAAVFGGFVGAPVPNFTPDADYTELTDNGVNELGFVGLALATLYAVPGNPDLSPGALCSQVQDAKGVIASEIASTITGWYINDSFLLPYALEFAQTRVESVWGWFGMPAIGEGSVFEPEPASWGATYWTPAEMAFNSPQWIQTYWTPAEMAFNGAEAVLPFSVFWAAQYNMGLGYYAP